MGDMADAIIDGEFDYITGEYIGRGVGYPRSFHDNYKTRYDKDRNVNGVKNYLLKKGFNLQIHDDIIKSYGIDKLMQQKKVKSICAEIQKDFNAFIQWVSKIPLPIDNNKK